MSVKQLLFPSLGSYSMNQDPGCPKGSFRIQKNQTYVPNNYYYTSIFILSICRSVYLSIIWKFSEATTCMIK